MIHPTAHPLAGQTVTVAPKAPFMSTTDEAVEYRVEDWWDRVTGGSWMFADGNPAALSYAVRGAVGGLPTDNEVVYGKTKDGLGHLVHVSEIAEAVSS